MNICILVLTNTQKSDGASRIRPVKLIAEFEKYHTNLNVYYLREGDKVRQLFFKFLFNKTKFDLCYIEPHTFPLSFSEKLIILIHLGLKVKYMYNMETPYQLGSLRKNLIEILKEWNGLLIIQKHLMKKIRN